MFLRWYVAYILSVLLVVLAGVARWQQVRMSEDAYAIVALEKQLAVVRGLVEEARLKASAAEQAAEARAVELAQEARRREAALKSVEDLKQEVAALARVKMSATEREAAARADLETERRDRETAERALKTARDEREAAVRDARRVRAELAATAAAPTMAEAAPPDGTLLSGAPQNDLPPQAAAGPSSTLEAAEMATGATKEANASPFTATGAISDATALAVPVDEPALAATSIPTDLPLPVRKPPVTKAAASTGGTTTGAADSGSPSAETPPKPNRPKKARPRSAPTKPVLDSFFNF